MDAVGLPLESKCSFPSGWPTVRGASTIFGQTCPWVCLLAGWGRAKHMSYIRRRRSHQSPNEGPLWVFCHYSTLWATTHPDAESTWRHPIITTLALVCLGVSAEKGPLLLRSLPTEVLNTLTARWIINLLPLRLHPLLDKQHPPHDKREGESISFAYLPVPPGSPLSLLAHKCRHICPWISYNNMGGVTVSSAHLLNTYKLTPQFQNAVDSLVWIQPLISNTLQRHFEQHWRWTVQTQRYHQLYMDFNEVKKSKNMKAPCCNCHSQIIINDSSSLKQYKTAPRDQTYYAAKHSYLSS